MGKLLRYSATAWLNLIALLILLAQYFGDINLIPADVLGYITAILNIVVRWLKTSQPITGL